MIVVAMPLTCTTPFKIRSISSAMVCMPSKHCSSVVKLMMVLGPPLVTPAKSFEQTHAEFHEMPRKKKLGRYIFCGVCGVSLKVENADRGVVDELVRKVGLETGEINGKSTNADVEEDDKSAHQVAELSCDERG